MRIAQISTPFVPVPPRGYGGTELVVQNLCADLRARGHEVTLYATGDSRVESELRYRFSSARWPPNPIHEWEQAAFALTDALRRTRGFDVIHSHVSATIALQPLFPAPLVHTLHHVAAPALSELYADHPQTSYVAISRRQRELERGFRIARVVHHGLDVEIYPEGTPDPRAAYLAFLGRLSPCKGADVAIDVAGKAGRTLRVGGAFHMEEGVEANLQAALLRRRLALPWVQWLGEVGHRQKVALLGGAEALLFPIQWEEPFGLVAAEAMLCGCPVVAFARGAVPELIDEGVTGFAVDSPEEMTEAVRRRIPGIDRHACRERARERFSAQRMVEGYLEVYRLAIERWRATPRGPAPSSPQLGGLA